MKQISKIGIIKCHLNNFKNLARLTFFLFFFLIISNVNAEEEMKQERFGVHAGINSAVLDNAFGPFFSFHFTPRSEKVLLFETMLFYGRNSGRAFISGAKIESSALGLAAGLRINILPRKNWNPSFVIMPGIAYGSEKSYEYSDDGTMFAFCFGFSNTLYKKHMISLGLIGVSDVFGAFYITYGFWF